MSAIQLDTDVDETTIQVVRSSVPPTFGERCLGWGFYTGLRLLSATWRMEIVGLHLLDDLAGQRHVLTFWHRHYIALFRFFRDRPIIALTNRSHRGQVIANMCHRTGVRPIQLEKNGKKRMFRALECVVDDGLGIGITVDGPLGPACEVKPVVLHLASRLDMTVVPLSVAVDHKYAVKGRWDHLEIPYPFSRIAFEIGVPVQLSPTETREGLRDFSFELKRRIDQGTERARQRLGRANGRSYR